MCSHGPQVVLNFFTLIFHSQLSSQPLFLLCNGFVNTVVIIIGIGVIRRISNMDFHSPRHCWMPVLPTAETNTVPHYGAIMISQLLVGARLITLEVIHYGRHSTLFLLEETLLWTYICPWCLQCVSQTTVHRFTGYLIYSIAHSIMSEPRNSFHSK